MFSVLELLDNKTQANRLLDKRFDRSGRRVLALRQPSHIESRPITRGESTFVDLVRRAAAQSLMRAMLVVPEGIRQQFLLEAVGRQRGDDTTRTFVFDGPN